MKLQRFGYCESRYERPNQAWQCQWAAQGRACDAGPSPEGACSATFECLPNRNGDRWVCTRDLIGGGRCSEGPGTDGRCSRPIPPCAPVLSLRRHRGYQALWILALVTGLLLLVASGPMGEALVSPGGIAFVHAAEGVGCDACHAAAGQGVVGWVAAALQHRSGDDSHRCIDCHDLGPRPFEAHNASAQLLADYASESAPARNRTSQLLHDAARLLPVSAISDDSGAAGLSCVPCHSEHRGSDGKLIQLGDDQCHACHKVAFGDFESGHPEFSDYPFERRTRIIFDHDSHRDKYFPDESVEFSCQSCHVGDSQGQTMLIAPFEVSCGSCHSAEIRGEGRSGEMGLPLIGVPGLDIDTLAEHDMAIGQWPEDADAELSPFMILLLSADPAWPIIQPLLTQRDDGIDLLDLSDADDQQLAAVAELAWAVKRLLRQLAMRGQVALQQRLMTADGGDMSMKERAALSGGLAQEPAALAWQRWFPNGDDELQRHARGERVVASDADVNAEAEADTDDGDSDSDGDSGEDIAAVDIIDGIDADEVIPASDAIDLGEEETLPGGDDEIVFDEEPESTDPDDALMIGDEDAPAGGDDEIVPGDEGEIFGGDDETIDTSGDPMLADDSDEDAPGESVDDVELEGPLEADATVPGGGWYRRYYTLYYRPAVHQDSMLWHWLEHTRSAVAEAAQGGAQAVPRAAVFEAFADPAAPGRCGKCHSIDVLPDGDLRVNWRGRQPDSLGQGALTRFSHATHNSLMGEQGCLRCHRTREQPEDGYLDSYKQRHPLTSSGNFETIELNTCSECHRSGAANNGCLTCHEYHLRPTAGALSEPHSQPRKPAP